MRDNLDINAVIDRSRRKWQLVELCSPVKVWVAHQRRKRLQGQWCICRGQTPREAMRQRELLEILQREGARKEAALPPHLEREAMMLLKGDML